MLLGTGTRRPCLIAASMSVHIPLATAPTGNRDGDARRERRKAASTAADGRGRHCSVPRTSLGSRDARRHRRGVMRPTTRPRASRHGSESVAMLEERASRPGAGRRRCAPPARRVSAARRQTHWPSSSRRPRRIRRSRLSVRSLPDEAGDEIVDGPREQLVRCRVLHELARRGRSRCGRPSSPPRRCRGSRTGSVLRSDFCMRRNSSWITSRLTGSRRANGSSINSTGGSAASARATPTRCACPPDSSFG